eukprot:GFYU01008688.1.p1 GENE.GFYU01008688.1~~GFYU01008688.1.p1  ORF type:complete len:923 (+),score=271.43 GFYU01008688.1:186-2954(+)
MVKCPLCCKADRPQGKQRPGDDEEAPAPALVPKVVIREPTTQKIEVSNPIAEQPPDVEDESEKDKKQDKESKEKEEYKQHHEDILSIVTDGDTKKLAEYLKKMKEKNVMFDVNYRDPIDNTTPLFRACRCGHESIVRYLLASKAKITLTDSSGFTCLQGAAEAGFDLCVHYILTHENCNLQFIEQVDETGWSALWLAVLNGHKKVVDRLLQHGANVMRLDKKGHSMLNVAITKQDRGMVQLLWNAIPTDGRHEQVLAMASTERISLLVQAACTDNVEMAHTVIDVGVDFNGIDQSGKTVLEWAHEKQSRKVQSALLDAGANLVMVSHRHYKGPQVYNNTVTEFIIAGLHPDDLGDMITPERVNDEASTTGYQPLHEAAMQGDPIWVKVLLEHGAKITAQESQGMTPLHFAAKFGHSKVIEEICKSGREYVTVLQWKEILCIQDHNGLMPIDLAANTYCRKLLEEAGSPSYYGRLVGVHLSRNILFAGLCLLCALVSPLYLLAAVLTSPSRHPLTTLYGRGQGLSPDSEQTTLAMYGGAVFIVLIGIFSVDLALPDDRASVAVVVLLFNVIVASLLVLHRSSISRSVIEVKSSRTDKIANAKEAAKPKLPREVTMDEVQIWVHGWTVANVLALSKIVFEAAQGVTLSFTRDFKWDALSNPDALNAITLLYYNPLNVAVAILSVLSMVWLLVVGRVFAVTLVLSSSRLQQLLPEVQFATYPLPVPIHNYLGGVLQILFWPAIVVFMAAINSADVDSSTRAFCLWMLICVVVSKFTVAWHFVGTARDQDVVFDQVFLGLWWIAKLVLASLYLLPQEGATYPAVAMNMIVMLALGIGVGRFKPCQVSVGNMLQVLGHLLVTWAAISTLFALYRNGENELEPLVFLVIGFTLLGFAGFIVVAKDHYDTSERVLEKNHSQLKTIQIQV